MAQTLTQIKALLAAHGLRPKHKFGQNFLHDHNHMARIMDAAGLQPGERVLEVGPGTGALTGRLLEADVRVVAVEVDTDLEPILREQFDADERFALVMGDVLAGKHAINPAVWEALDGQASFKLIANLPYQVASPLMVNLILSGRMERAVVMVQKEVADRLGASAGGKDYGPLSVMVQAGYRVERVGVLGPGCFWPSPKVASAVVRMDRLDQPVTRDLARLSGMCQTLFQKRRKQLGAILGREVDWPSGVQATDRPEVLTVAQIAALAERIG